MAERLTGKQSEVKNKHIVRKVAVIVLAISAALAATKWYADLPGAQQRELFDDLFGQAVPNKQSTTTDSIIPLS